MSKGQDPKTPLTGNRGRESVFDRRLLEYRNTGGFEKPRRKTLEYLRKPTAQFETPSMDSKLHAAEIAGEQFTETERLAFVDESSGLLNSRTIMSRVSNEVRRSKRYKHDFSILLIELDTITTIASLTPLAVEMIFHTFCKVLKDNIREVDIVGRFDRSSALLICPETTISEVIVEAERLRQVVSVSRFKQLGHNQTLTVSIGIAAFPMHGNTDAELLGAVMQATQNAVAAGGNKMCAADVMAAPDQPKTVAPTEDFSPTSATEKCVDMRPAVDMSPSNDVVFPTVQVNPIVS